MSYRSREDASCFNEMSLYLTAAGGFVHLSELEMDDGEFSEFTTNILILQQKQVQKDDPFAKRHSKKGAEIESSMPSAWVVRNFPEPSDQLMLKSRSLRLRAGADSLKMQ